MKSTNLVEEEIWTIPWYWEHAPHQEQTLHHQICGEGVTKEGMQSVFWKGIIMENLTWEGLLQDQEGVQ